ncbi:DNA gyrase inhibitor YacG [Permianibacter aggregans]|uniref:DNA gyrase inhibitor YacG n=1 Tax=Permianibacter aggregans TaxID=1510150 RepID=A0A4R6UEQ0_9GAMM|nr:DNA gyrase inhibitor YacG [Permianibacter aggregans]QGX39020.1 DNA gyrase inhibitor YacG [Permianibacter aggregans]TDQ44642.1 hypothetical protein EV696_12345 [Permianibacter aggregans]
MSKKPPLIVRCPQCHKSIVYDKNNPFRPFCSDRCRLIDLGEWASEGHRIPGQPVLQTDNGDDEH